MNVLLVRLDLITFRLFSLLQLNVKKLKKNIYNGYACQRYWLILVALLKNTKWFKLLANYITV